MKRRLDLTYIDRKVEKIPRTRIRHISVIGFRSPLHQPGRHWFHLVDGEGAARKHRHEYVGSVHKHRAKDLLGHIKEPDLDGTLGPLAPSLVDESEKSQAA